MAVLALVPSTANSYAATADSVPDQTVEVEQGETSATFSAKAELIYTDGYDLSAQINPTSPPNPSGVSLVYGAVALSDSSSTAVRSYRESTNPTDDGLIEYTISVPADAPIGENYATFILDYTVADFIAPASLAAIQSKMNVTVSDRLSNMSQLTSQICAAATYDDTNYGNNANNTIVLTDTRSGGQDYRVRKLKDDKCWMIDNLKLGGAAPLTLTAADSDVQTDFVLPAAILASGTSSVDTSPQMADPSVAFGWCATPVAPEMQGSLSGCGNFYNFLSATAGWGEATVLSGSSPSSICPKGWHLPSGGPTAGASDFSALDMAYGGNGTTQSTSPSQLATLWSATGAFSGILTGYYGYYYDRFGEQNNYAQWWSSAASVNWSSPYAYRASVSSTVVVPGTTDSGRVMSLSVRCVVT